MPPHDTIPDNCPDPRRECGLPQLMGSMDGLVRTMDDHSRHIEEHRRLMTNHQIEMSRFTAKIEEKVVSVAREIETLARTQADTTKKIDGKDGINVRLSWVEKITGTVVWVTAALFVAFAGAAATKAMGLW